MYEQVLMCEKEKVLVCEVKILMSDESKKWGMLEIKYVS